MTHSLSNPLKSLIFATAFVIAAGASAQDFNSWPTGIQTHLKKGNVALLPNQPGEKGTVDKRFVTMAKLVKGTRAEIWEVIIDKEDAEKFLDGVLESRIIERKGNEMIMEQKTKVGGPKGSYQYTLKYLLTPEQKAEFSFVKGEIKDVAGAWWILDGPTPEQKLVVYSLYIDPGAFAPQFIVRKGMKKTLPETIISTEQEIIRRRTAKSR